MVTIEKFGLKSICEALFWSDDSGWDVDFYATPSDDFYDGLIYEEKLEDSNNPFYRNRPNREVAIRDRFIIPLFSISSHLNDQHTIIGLQSEMGVQNAGPPGAYADSSPEKKAWYTSNAIPLCFFMP